MIPPEPTPRDALGLEASHLRHIGAILLLLDQRLDEMERWASWPLPAGPLYRWERNLGAEASQAIREEVAKARRELQAIIERFELEPQVKVATTSIQTLATFSLIDLEELEPRRIAAYGALPGAQAQELSGLWATLRESLEAIRRQCARAQAGEGEP